jgi:anti-sigma B factor antagonist
MLNFGLVKIASALNILSVLDASARRAGDVVVLRLNGRISKLSGGDLELRDLVIAALERGDRKLLLDLRGVPYIDSSGIGELVAASSAAKERGGAIRLCSLSPKVCSMFEMVALLEVFDVRENEKDGLAAFGAGSSS